MLHHTDHGVQGGAHCWFSPTAFDTVVLPCKVQRRLWGIILIVRQVQMIVFFRVGAIKFAASNVGWLRYSLKHHWLVFVDIWADFLADS